MKKITEYLVLAIILLGVPFLCATIFGHEELLAAVKQFPPRTEDFHLHPELLWNVRRPFNWIAFLLMVAVVWFDFLKPLVKRIAAVWGTPHYQRTAMERTALATCLRQAGFARQICPYQSSTSFPWWGWLGLVLMIGAWVLSWSRFEWFRPYQVMCSYFPIWLGFITVMNALCVRRSGHCPATDHPLVYLISFPASSLFWWFFEYLDRYVWNWYYRGISELSAFKYVVYATICFASVLPAVMAVAAYLRTFRIFDDDVFKGMAKIDLYSIKSRVTLLIISLVGLLGIVIAPDWTYPFIWISPLTAFLLIQVLFKEKSAVIDAIARGDWSLYFRYGIATLVCGICWETWNYYALAKWVYAVPWVHRWQIWEMPVIGFAGYLPFGSECAVVLAWLYSAFGIDFNETKIEIKKVEVES